MGGYGNDNTLNPESRVGFTVEDSSQGKDPHYRTRAWYGGTVDLGWNQDENNSPFETFIHRRKGDFSRSELDPDPNNLLPWYTPNHTFQDLGDEDAQWEGIGTGWYYSVLGNGYFKRDLLNQENENSPVIPPQRTPLEFDNTAEARMRGDFAVPTLFNGNFDAIYEKNSVQSIPGWSLHSGQNSPTTVVTTQNSLIDWREIDEIRDVKRILQTRPTVERSYLEQLGIDPNSPNYQSNYALKLENNQEITHNRFVVPGQGSLRFNLHVPRNSVNNTNPGNLIVSIKGNTDTDYQELETIQLKQARSTITQYPSDIYKPGYSTKLSGNIDNSSPWFETFTIEIPDEYRDQVANIKFKLDSNPGEVYLDDVFFKSNHLRFGNPSEAEHHTELNKNDPNNYLLEHSQFATAYDNSKKSPKWVSWQVDQTWLGNEKREGKFIEDPAIPEGGVWGNRLKGGGESGSPDSAYKDSGYDRGHLAPNHDRKNSSKNNVAINLMSNIVPQHKDNNEFETSWFNFEEDLLDFVRERPSKELYVIAGGYGSDDTSYPVRRDRSDYTNPNILTNQGVVIPRWTWKTVLLLDEHGLRADDIQSNAVTYAVMTPNRVLPDTDEFDAGITHPFIELGINPPTPANAVINSEQEWNNWETWRLTVNQLENLPAIDGLPALGLDFFSLIPTSIQEDIENNLYSRDNLINYSASLLAESETLSFSPSFFVSNTAIRQNSVVQDDISWRNNLDPRTISEISPGQISILDFGTEEIGTSQIGIGQVGEFQVSPSQISPGQISSSQISPSHIATNQVSPGQISSSQISPSHIATNQVSSSQISLDQFAISHIATNQVSPSQISISQNNSYKTLFSRFDSSEEFFNRNNFSGVISDTAIGHGGVTEEGFFVLVPSNSTQISPSEVSIGQIGTGEKGFTEISVGEVDPSQISQHEIGFTQISPTKVSSSQIHTPPTTLTQIGIGEVDSNKTFVGEISTFEDDSREISFPSSISSEQLINIHNSTPKIINRLNNSATKIWSDLLSSKTQLDINFQITNLPTGQLAEATITGFDDSGKPNAGTILIDRDANGVGWFVDETPLDNSEFTAQNTDSYLLTAAESEASGKYDLLTAVLHELAHLYGFMEGYSGFDGHVDGEKLFISDNFTATLDEEHLDKEAHPYDLLNTHLAPGMRKLPSELDVRILQAILAESDGETRRQGDKEKLEAALTSDPLLAIANGDFSISDTTTDTFAWDTRGASGIENGQAILTEDSPFLSNFTQTFTVPESAKTLQFKLVETDLGASELVPPDALEVALLDANTNESLVSDNDLTATDSLLNIQNDGTAYFSDKVRIGGASSGEIIDLDRSRTVTIDISHLAAGTEATLYFDLLGFGDVDSRVVIDDVRLSDQFLLTPIAVDDTANTTQGQAVEIDIVANDIDDDGTIATNSVEIQTQPSNGSVIPRADGTVSYIPGTGFVGTDTFTYVVQDNDGQFSEPATVEVTVANVAPEITEIQVPDNLTEGLEFTLNAVATDAGNDQLTYSWEIDGQQLSDNNQQIDYTLPDNGTYSGSVTVSDPYNGSDTQAFEIEVNNAAPVVDAGADQIVNEGSAINFTGSYNDTGINDTHTVSWDLGDGNQLTVNSNQSTVEHTYIDDGKYTATYTVTDNDGAVGSDTVEVTVNNVAPTITNLTGDSSVKEGDTVNFSATATDPGDDALTYTWDFGDGETATGTDVAHIYTDNGNYTVTVTVTDDDAASTSSTLYVTVANVAPEIVEVHGNLSLDEGDTVTYTATATDPGDDTLTYTWDFGDGTDPIMGHTVNHLYVDDGEYTITLTVRDEDGGVTTSSFDVGVEKVFNLKAEGKIRINGHSVLDGEPLNTDDDTRIYAGGGFTINGNQTLPVQRDANGNPLKQGKKSLLVDRFLTVSPNYTESRAHASENKYVGIIPPQVIDELAVTVPEHQSLIDSELSSRIAPGTTPVAFDPQQNPLNNANDWTNKFPAPGTTNHPTVVSIVNGGLNIPSGVDLSDYVIIVENGDLNFNGNGHHLDNVVLINRNGSINLAAVESDNLSVLASGSININRNARFGGDTLIAAGNSNSNINFDGATTNLESDSNLQVISQGNIIFNSSSTTKGNFIAAKNFTSNGRSSLIGSIEVQGDITINGGIELVKD